MATVTGRIVRVQLIENMSSIINMIYLCHQPTRLLLPPAIPSILPKPQAISLLPFSQKK